MPQHRERIFLVAFRKGIKFENQRFSLNDVQIASSDSGPVLADILHYPDELNPDHRFVDEAGRVKGRYVLSDHLWEYLQSYAEKHRARGNGFGFSKFGPGDVARTLSARYHKDGSEILIARRGSSKPRRLTPRECARLMGFDEAGDVPFRLPEDVSDTQLYRQLGNALVVPVVREIGKQMRGFLAEALESSRPRKRRVQIPIKLREPTAELVDA